MTQSPSWLEEIEARLKAVPRGPWTYCQGSETDHWELWNDEESIVQDDSGVDPSTEVLEYISNSPTDTALLISALREAMEALKEVEHLGMRVNLNIPGDYSLKPYAFKARTALEKIAKLGSAVEKMGSEK